MRQPGARGHAARITAAPPRGFHCCRLDAIILLAALYSAITMPHTRAPTRGRARRLPLLREPPAPRAFAAAVLAAAVALLAAAAPGVVVQGAPLGGPACVNEFPKKPLCRFVDDLAAAPRVEVDASMGRTIRIGAYQIYQAKDARLWGQRINPLFFPTPFPPSLHPQKLHRDLPATKLYAYGLNDLPPSAIHILPALPPPTILPPTRPQKLHRDPPATKLYAYGLNERTAHYPGPTLVARRGIATKVWPHLAVRRTRYRFRVLGAASSRFFNLRFVCAAPHNYPDFTPPITGDVLPIVQIGTDGGYLPHPVTCSSLLLAPGERHDILVDFSSLPASCADVILTNDAPAPFPSGEAPGRNATGVVMRFVVDRTGGVVPSPPVPKKLVSLPKLRLSRVSKERWMTAVEVSSPQRITFDGRGFSDSPTETPKRNSEELWHIINDTPDAHPIHLHLIMHRPLARRPFNRTAYCNSQCAFPGNSSANSSLPTCFTGEGSSVRVSGRAGSVGEYERGWKDTTVLQRDEVLTLWTGCFSQDGSPFPFNPTRGPGYVWHCHILEHEDNDMMRPLIVT
ncbi:unnamed protein product [Closterium sp. Naga37s-1]|nr:unnamed protein product [Closterium sp. Naga37s-1]